MRILVCLAVAAMVAAPASAQVRLSPADQAAAFKAAGFKRVGGQWRGCDDPGTPSYSPGTIELVKDLNGDGRPEVVITEGGSFCFGATGMGFALMSKQGDGNWKRMAGGTGVFTPLATKGVGGWPDIEIGGPGFCFPIQRWNGREYRFHRRAYQGKPCR